MEKTKSRLLISDIEIWKDIPEYENKYWISSHGQIKNKKGLILSGHVGTTGYIHVNLYKETKYKTFDIHRLVGLLFVDNPENLPCINHIDGIKINNHFSNIEWTTYRNNTHHAIIKGLRNDDGENSKNSKLTSLQVKEIRNNSQNISRRELANKYNIHPDYVGLIINKKRWKSLK